jgi:hypothetical protein
VLLKISWQQQHLFVQTLPIVRQIRLSSSKRPEGGSLFFMLDKRLKLNQKVTIFNTSFATTMTGLWLSTRKRKLLIDIATSLAPYSFCQWTKIEA